MSFLEKLAIVLTILGAIWGFWKIIEKPIVTFFVKTKYNYGTGYHIIQDIEKRFGKDAADKLVEFMKKSDSFDITTDMRLDMLEDAANIGIYVCNTDGKCIYANHTLCKMFGTSKEAMLGFGWIHGVVDKEKAYKNWMFSVNNNIPYEDNYEYLVENTIVKFKTVAEPKTAEKNGVVLGYVGVVKKEL